MDIVTVDESKEFYENSKKFPYLTVLLKIPEELWTPIVDIQKELQSIDPRQLYCPLSYFRVSLKEIGGLGLTVNERDLPKIEKAIEKVASSNRSFRNPGLATNGKILLVIKAHALTATLSEGGKWTG